LPIKTKQWKTNFMAGRRINVLLNPFTPADKTVAREMVGRYLAAMAQHCIVLEPGILPKYIARLETTGEIIANSLTPFCAAARTLLARGIDPSDTLIARHKGSQTIALKAKIRVAAKLTVSEAASGSLSFAPWKDLTALHDKTADADCEASA
jgi:hypothetical protein